MRPPYIVQFSTTGSKPTALLGKASTGQSDVTETMDDPTNRADNSSRQSSTSSHPISPSPQPVCGICHGKFWNPKGLNCFHTFCRDCLQQNARIRGQPARITCPTCLDEFLLPENGIEGLPVNIFLDPIRKAKELAAFNANLYKAKMKTRYNCADHCSKLECQQSSPSDLTDLETLVQSCRAKLQERHLVMKKLNQHGIEMKHNMLEIKQQVKDFVQQIISDLNHEELRLMNDLDSRYRKNESALSKAKVSIERTNDFLQEACNNAEKLCGDCPNANTICLSQMELSDLLAELSKPFNIEEFHFLPITQNIMVKGLGSIVTSPKQIPTDELKAIHYGGFLTNDTTVKKAQTTVTKNSNGSSSKVLVTNVCNPDVKSNHVSGKEKKMLDQNRKTSDETIPHKTYDETIPRKTADETIPHKTRKTADETIPQKTADGTIPHKTRKTADETIPRKTADETIPQKTADETIPHKTSDETIPRKTADETIPHKTRKTADETIPQKTADGTIPQKTRKTADETIPQKTADETIPHKTSDETIPQKTADETIPQKTADETIALKTADKTRL
ncbi:tripartite motif-containing protein 2-like [Branchiostoma floridae]|uniref:Tripartite motif-containing protein 2-like n=1 Tax=Branchiostoma floridae TaxID=7739 RepID=A0A9J7LLS1_BRAFL|nr:tripartite motif-containing protein 2-like [Branchiostoma floridae]